MDRRSGRRKPLLPPANKPPVSAATAGVSPRVLVARQEYLLLSADPREAPERPLVAGLSDRAASASRRATGCGTATAAAVTPTLKPATSKIVGLASAACVAAWWIDCFDARISLPFVCGLAGGCYALLADDGHDSDRPTRQNDEHRDPRRLEEPEEEPMWTLAQLDHFGALRLDRYVRFVLAKLAVVWRAIAALHKTAVNYKFTVSISDEPSLSELQDLLEGRAPLLLTYDNVKEHDHHGDDDNKLAHHHTMSRSRGSSRASTAVTDDSWMYRESMDSSCFRESMDLSGLDLDEASSREACDESVGSEKPRAASNEFHALEDQEGVTEYFTIEEDGCGCSDDESDTTASSATLELDNEKPTTPPRSPKRSSTPSTPKRRSSPAVTITTTEAKIAAMRPILVPLIPVEQLAREINAHRHHAASSTTHLEPVVVPSVKPLIPDTKPSNWRAVAPHARPEAAALLARQSTKPAAKRRISVNVTSMKPLPRLVVKARPSTLTPPQNVQRMLDQVERMMREVHELLAAGRDVLRSVETPAEKMEAARRCKKSVSFSDDVSVIDSALGLAVEEERALRASMSYGSDEIESMSNDFFAELSLPSLDL